MDIEAQFDHEIEFYSGIGRHDDPKYEKDVQKMVQQWKDCDLFKMIPGRCFAAFAEFKECKNKENPKKLDKWLSSQKSALARKDELQKRIKNAKV